MSITDTVEKELKAGFGKIAKITLRPGVRVEESEKGFKVVYDSEQRGPSTVVVRVGEYSGTTNAAVAYLERKGELRPVAKPGRIAAEDLYKQPYYFN
jgi:hypothetical protein